ncbi:DUF4246 domain-containing protein [Phanerochaete sordida]|uniref:DUF4246 domain-containing protein n=1 Tax=Phanerochaete sordida TaxID=48140 RepID=A0A9P3LD12_9APHY|nr:DUF4246 domain-containing protein [Phanerochaete sordida]
MGIWDALYNNDIDDTRPLRISNLFRHPFRDRESGCEDGSDLFDDPPLAMNERNMLALSASLRDQPNWWNKTQDPEACARCKAEAVGAPVPYGDIPLTSDEVEYVLDEIAWHASQRDSKTGIEASIFERIWQSDHLVDDTTRSGLLHEVAQLENVPTDQKDWHPGTDEQVLNLVDPSLYCLDYEETEAWSEYDASPLFPEPDLDIFDDCQDVGGRFFSLGLSWLPTDFAISKNASRARAIAYINNLDPHHHASAYAIVEQLVARFVPLFERVLTESQVAFGCKLRRFVQGDYWWEDIELDSEDSGDDDHEDVEPGEARTLHLPSVKKFSPYDIRRRHMRLSEQTIQVVIKLDSVILTPSKPFYAGEQWHVAGMANDGIVAVGMYAYDSHNVTKVGLGFRMAVVTTSLSYEEGDEEGVKAAYGFAQDDPLNQQLGVVSMTQGRCVAFPNVYQHRREAFELADKSKPGHCKFMTLFLVDPRLPKLRPSTTDIPPQQPDWMRSLLQEIATKLREGSGATGTVTGLGRLPLEILDMIVDEAEWLATKQEATERRLQLLDEHEQMRQAWDDALFCIPFVGA